MSVKLSKEFGRGFGVTTLEDIRKFYLAYAIIKGDKKSHALRGELEAPKFHANLSWTHYRALMRVGRLEARKFYEVEAIKNRWSSRELERQINSLLFDRLAKSKDKVGLMKLVNQGQEISRPEDAIKDPCRQAKRLTLDGKHYYADLVFYHTVHKCNIIIDLKTRELTHAALRKAIAWPVTFWVIRRSRYLRASINFICRLKKS